ncbi:hypothetical protein SAY87_004820 [Trapa incisa]|uniref:Uncharacterized protein n=1 Tax=Trapa incisa TaxID=236973 RepID=A0AAN7PNF1_9MYRT|nr:hypothetical protein SAY87_004820 [Trapa incisa]
MGRSPCCDKVGLKKGPWTPEEDQKLLAYIEEHGHGSWRALPAKAGLQRCGKSCRLRWTNYLRPDIKRGKFSLQEEQTIIQLHALLGNRWSAIANHLPKRTDNEIKNYWNTHLKKRLAKMGIDPVTHKPKSDTLLSRDGQSNKSAAKLSHMAQWESARLEAEVRLVRESKLRSHSFKQSSSGGGGGGGISSSGFSSASTFAASGQLLAKTTRIGGDHLESPTSTLTFSDNSKQQQMTEFVGTSSDQQGGTIIKDESEHDWKSSMPNLGEFKESVGSHTLPFTSTGFHHDIPMSMSLETTPWTIHDSRIKTSMGGHCSSLENDIEAEGFTELLLNSSGEQSGLLEGSGGGGGNSENGGESGGSSRDYLEDNKNYWNSILNLVNSSPSDSPLF